MTIEQFLQQLMLSPESINFSESIAVVEANYDFTPTAFRNGEMQNSAGENSGSCKIFSFALLHRLSPEQTLQCFGNFYREDVLKNPEGTDHQNIRNFIRNGWSGVQFAGTALRSRNL